MGQHLCASCNTQIAFAEAQIGSRLACPRCASEFVAGQPDGPAISFRPTERSATSRVQSSGAKGASSTQTMLLAGILVCNVLLVGAVLAWEVRFQMLRSRIQEATQEFNQKLNQANRP